MALKRGLINHPNVRERLKVKSKGDPEEYDRLKNELRHAIMQDYDFIIVELDAFAAQQPKLLRIMVTKSVDHYFKPSQREDVLNWPEHNPKTIKRLVHAKIKEHLTRIEETDN